MQQITPQILRDWLDPAAGEPPVLLDVREAWEVELCRLPGAVHIPMAAIPARAAELNPSARIVVYCHHGGRSAQVAAFLERRGFGQVFNLSGGINQWARQIDPDVATY